MRKQILRRQSLIAAAISIAFCTAQPAAAATPGPVITVAAKARWPSVAIGGQGHFVVGWLAGNGSVSSPALASVYGDNGTPITSAPILLGPKAKLTPAVAMDSDGDFAAAWIETKYQQTTHGYQAPGELFVQRYSASGSATGARTQVASVVDYLSQYAVGLSEWGSATDAPRLVMDDDGDLDVAWSNFTFIGSCNFYGTCGPTSGTENVYAAAYRPDGTVLSPKTPVAESLWTASKRPKSLMGLAKLGNGNVSFTAYGFQGPTVLQQLLGPDLAKQGNSIMLTAPMPSQVVAIASDANGNTAVLWSDSTGKVCEVSRFDPQGVAIGAPSIVPIDGAPGCYEASLAMNASGAFAVTWGTGVSTSQGSPYTNLYGQLFNADGSTNGAAFAIREGSATIVDIAAAINADSTLVVVWSEYAGRSYSVFARRISP